MYAHEIDMKEFRAAAIVVRKLNPYAVNYDLDSFVDMMVRHANELKDGYCSTFGYVLSVFTFENMFKPDGSPKTGVKASIAYSVVESYLERVPAEV